jgi:hypothetical protein
LDVDDKDLFIKYKERGETKDYNFINQDVYNPYDITLSTLKDIREQRQALEEDFNVLNLPPEIDRSVIRILYDMRKDMFNIPLNGNFSRIYKT